MKIIKRWSLVLLSLLLALQLTAGLSEAKTESRTVKSHGNVTFLYYDGDPIVTPLGKYFYMVEANPVYSLTSPNHPELSSGTNFVKATIIGVAGSPESVLSGTWRSVIVPPEKAGWEGTFHGYSVAGTQPNSVRTEIFAEGKGWGEFTGYTETVQQTEIAVNGVTKSNTFVATITLPGK